MKLGSFTLPKVDTSYMLCLFEHSRTFLEHFVVLTIFPSLSPVLAHFVILS